MSMNPKVKALIEGKKITVEGLGLLGRGLGDVRFLASHGAILTVTNLKSKEALKESLASLQDIPNIVFHLGGHVPQDFKNCDMVLKAAGVPLDSPYIAEARKNNIPIEMSSALFTKYAEVTVIGVTGKEGNQR